MTKRQTNKKNKKNKLLLLILLLAMTAVLFGTGTYAWFTSNRTVDVNTIDVNVQTVNGLQISADAINWKAKIFKSDLTNAKTNYGTAVNQLPDTLDNVSSIGETVNGRMNMFYGNVNIKEDLLDASDDVATLGEYYLATVKQGEYNCTGDEACNAAGGAHFIAFDIFLKTNSDVDLKMTANSDVTAKANADGTITDRGIKNAARVAFVKLGHTVSTDTSDNMQALNTSTCNTSTSVLTENQAKFDAGCAYIWEPNYDKHTAAAIIAANEYYQMTDLVDGASQLAYRGVNQAFGMDNSTNKIDFATAIPLKGTLADTTHFTPVKVALATPAAHGEVAFVSLTAGVTKMRVYFWVEGQDVDAENEATGTNMSLNLEFTIN